MFRARVARLAKISSRLAGRRSAAVALAGCRVHSSSPRWPTPRWGGGGTTLPPGWPPVRQVMPHAWGFGDLFLGQCEPSWLNSGYVTKDPEPQWASRAISHCESARMDELELLVNRLGAAAATGVIAA